MNKIILTLILFTSIGYAQNRFEIVTAKVDFTSNAALEVISATTDKVIGLIDPRTKQFAFIVNTGSFKGFNSELQRQHFNEKYLETEKFYQSTFSGAILDSVNFNADGVHIVNAKGTLLIHGKKQPRTIPATITIKKGVAEIKSEFKVLLADHDIEIPKVVNQKVATEIYVNLKFQMAEKKFTKK